MELDKVNKLQKNSIFAPRVVYKLDKGEVEMEIDMDLLKTLSSWVRRSAAPFSPAVSNAHIRTCLPSRDLLFKVEIKISAHQLNENLDRNCINKLN